MIPKPTVLFSLGCLAVSLLNRPALAQARVDPSLPEAPLPQHRTLSLFPGYESVENSDGSVAPLGPTQKLETAYRMIVSPSLPVRAGITTAFEHAVGIGPFYGPGSGGVARLYGYNAANVASSFFFTDGVFPILFRQDPRYFPKRSGSPKSRVLWALRSNVVTCSDQGTAMPNYSSILGFGVSTALSDAYLPARNVSFGKTIEGIGIKEGVKFGFDLTREFGVLTWVEQRLKPH